MAFLGGQEQEVDYGRSCSLRSSPLGPISGSLLQQVTKVVEKIPTGGNPSTYEYDDDVAIANPKTGKTTVREVAGTIVTEDDKSFADLTANMWPLDSSVNRSLGSQISAQLKKQGLRPGDLVCSISITVRTC